MLLVLSGCVCVWLCSGAAQLHSQKTKATFSPHDSTAAERNAQSRRWRPLLGADSGLSEAQGSGLQGATRLAAERSGPQTRRGDAQARHTLVTEAGDERSPQELRPGPPCTVERNRARSPNARRAERREPLRAGALARAQAQAQAQEAEPPTGLNISDYGEEEPDYAAPDEPDPSPLPPVDPRTRRKPLRNPFYPLSAEAAGAYAVMLVSAVIFGVGVIGNVSVMCIVCHNFYMRSISNSLLASLALWDFSLLFFCLPLVLFHQLTGTWLLGPLSCALVPYVEVSVTSQHTEPHTHTHTAT